MDPTQLITTILGTVTGLIGQVLQQVQGLLGGALGGNGNAGGLGLALGGALGVAGLLAGTGGADPAALLGQGDPLAAATGTSLAGQVAGTLPGIQQTADGNSQVLIAQAPAEPASAETLSNPKSAPKKSAPKKSTPKKSAPKTSGASTAQPAAPPSQAASLGGFEKKDSKLETVPKLASDAKTKTSPSPRSQSDSLKRETPSFPKGKSA